ncbi:hypothetical protein JY742_20160 [Clostridioides difficile]|nr:hypothetical protein [Clostridioides difficile]
MAKEIKFFITDFKDFHTTVNKLIRTKEDLIRILLITIKHILINKNFKDEDKGEVNIIINKSSRLYFICKKPGELPTKYFSFAFPFFVEKDSYNNWIIKCKTSSHSINSEFVDYLLTLLDKGWFSDCNKQLDSIDKFACDYIDIINEYYNVRNIISEEQNFHETVNWAIIKTLLTFEPGYIRYDYDTEHETTDNHPLNHLDIYYAQSTFKLGFDKSFKISSRLDFNKFKDILENGNYMQKRCYLLK